MSLPFIPQSQQVMGALDSFLLKSWSVLLFLNVASPLVRSCRSGRSGCKTPSLPAWESIIKY